MSFPIPLLPERSVFPKARRPSSLVTHSKTPINRVLAHQIHRRMLGQSSPGLLPPLFGVP